MKKRVEKGNKWKQNSEKNMGKRVRKKQARNREGFVRRINKAWDIRGGNNNERIKWRMCIVGTRLSKRSRRNVSSNEFYLFNEKIGRGYNVM